MKIGDRVKCLTSVFIIPPYGGIGEIVDITRSCVSVYFLEYKKRIWLYKNEVEVVE